MAIREDYFSARAHCEIAFPVAGSRASGNQLEYQRPIRLEFENAMRGCATGDLNYDSARDRQVYKLESRMTLFHADDRRPAWLSALMRITNGATPGELPRPISTLARRWMENYGPGSITVINNPATVITGEVVAAEPGENGKFFPAQSYFDQQLAVKVAGRTFVNRERLRVSAKVNQWPPAGEVYHSEGTTAFYDVSRPGDTPAFTFGNCTIEILSPTSDEELAAARDFVESLNQ